MTLNSGKYACSAHCERGTCSNAKIIAARTVEERVLAGVREKLLTPAAVAETLRTMRETLDEEHRAAVGERLPIERELVQVARRLGRAQQMCLDGAMEIADL